MEASTRIFALGCDVYDNQGFYATQLPLLLTATLSERRYKEGSACSVLDGYLNQFTQTSSTQSLLSKTFSTLSKLNLA